MRKLSIIIVNYNTPEITAEAIRRIFGSEPFLDFEIIVVENGSSKLVEPSALKDDRIILVNSAKNLGFAGGVNLGIKKSTGEYVFLLNSDAFMFPGALSRAIDWMHKNYKTGVAGLSIITTDGAIQPSCGFFPSIGRELMRFSMLSKKLPGGTLVWRNRFTEKKFFINPVEADWVSGGAMLIKRAVLERIGMLDSGFFFGIEDWDFCKRAKDAGFKVAYLPFSQVLHLHGGSSGGRRSTWSLEREAEGFGRFMKKHYPSRFFLRLSVGILYNFKVLILEMGLIQNAKVKMQNDK
jgi:GT2 family glycosyltransferase